jgi:SAM-dependent methyltransferase
VQARIGHTPGVSRQANVPPRRLRVAGKLLSALVTRAPFLWPLLRRPTKRFWERNAGGWDERTESERPERLAPLLAGCEHLDTEPAQILELGTGTGSGAIALARRYPQAEVVGVDLADAMVAAAEAKLPAELRGRVRFRVADASELPFEDRAFDLVVQLNLPAYFGETARVLRPGGHVVVASSLGRATPYFTPDAVLRRGFGRRGIEIVATGTAAAGTYFVARRT